MKKIIVAAAISMAALVGCTSQSAPAPTVTVTEQIPAPSVDDGAVSSSERFVEFVRQNGGVYGAVANESDIVGIGNTICDGFAGGLTEDEITKILAQSLVNNNMANDDGAKFGASLIVGAKTYLCSVKF
jgi:hypothetical protein